MIGRIAFAALALSASLAQAQAPVITPQGDPSVRSDTIYRLAADSANYPDDPYVWLLDDGVVRIDDRGRVTATYRAVIHILQEEALELAERTYAYSPSRERFRVNWARVLRPDGTVISATPAHELVSDYPVPTSDPIFTDRKIHRLTLGGVTPGTIIDVSVTTEDIEPILARDFTSPWSVTTGAPVRRSRLIVEAPESLPLRIRERNLSFRRRETARNGARTYVWATADIEKPRPEPFAADSNNTVYQSISISGPVAWADIARWYADLARDRQEPTPAVRAQTNLLVRSARTLDDSLRALQRFIARDLRYVSLSLGIGGYRPRLPDEVLETRFGDCKDKTTLFISMARALGLRAHPVLVSSFGGVRREAPSLSQFDHMIVALEGSRGYTYSDMTSAFTPWGELPINLQREFGLVVKPDGTGEDVTLPADPRPYRIEMLLAGTLSPDGRFNGRFTKTMSGPGHEAIRATFARPYTAEQREEFLRGLGAAVYEAGRADSVEVFDGSDLSATPRVTVRISGARAARVTGNTAILAEAFGSPQVEPTIEALEAHVPRKFWIEAAQFFGDQTHIEEIRLTLPEGWQAQLPDNVEATSSFGSYKAEFSQNGRELRVRRELVGSRAVEPPERVDEMLAWLRRIAQDDGEYIALTIR